MPWENADAGALLARGKERGFDLGPEWLPRCMPSRNPALGPVTCMCRAGVIGASIANFPQSDIVLFSLPSTAEVKTGDPSPPARDITSL